MERTITIQQIKDVAQEAYNLYKDNTDGKNADYIPYLTNIDPKLFGISICLMNGEIIQLGDSQYRFGIESVSKVLTAILVLRQYGAPKVLEMIGADATGLPFNSIMAILLENDHPSTPLVNAGAISANSMVQPVGNSDAKWWRRCYRTAVQLHHGHLVGKRPSVHPIGKRRRHLGQQYGATRRKQRCQVESHRRQYDRTMRKYPATDRRTVPVRVGDKFQQPFHRLAIEKL